MRTWVEFILWLINKWFCCFSPKFSTDLGKNFTEYVLALRGRLSVGVCGSAELHIRKEALSSLIFRCSRLSEDVWFRLKLSRYSYYRLYSSYTCNSLQSQGKTCGS